MHIVAAIAEQKRSKNCIRQYLRFIEGELLNQDSADDVLSQNAVYPDIALLNTLKHAKLYSLLEDQSILPNEPGVYIIENSQLYDHWGIDENSRVMLGHTRPMYGGSTKNLSNRLGKEHIRTIENCQNIKLSDCFFKFFLTNPDEFKYCEDLIRRLLQPVWDRQGFGSGRGTKDCRPTKKTSRSKWPILHPSKYNEINSQTPTPC